MARSRSAALLVTLAAACGEPAPRAPEPSPPPSARASEYPSDESAWAKFHSKRFQLTIPLPDGRSWKIDDHSRPALLATHEGTSSKLHLLSTQEGELVNRQKCETRARQLGWVPALLTSVDDEVTVGPEAYDSRLWVAIEAAGRGGALTGHVFLFGAFIHKCLLVHLETTVPSAQAEGALAARLAVGSARVVRALALDPPRTTDDAAVPKDKPESRR